MFVWSSNRDEVTNDDRHQTADDTYAATGESIGDIHDSEQRAGPHNVYWNRHVVDMQIRIAEIRSAYRLMLSERSSKAQSLPKTLNDGRQENVEAIDSYRGREESDTKHPYERLQKG